MSRAADRLRRRRRKRAPANDGDAGVAEPAATVVTEPGAASLGTDAAPSSPCSSR